MRLLREQWLPVGREEVFRFFSDAANLERLTPPWLRFRIVSAPGTIEQGTLIDYRLRIHGIPLRWRSEIATWNPPTQFVDVQRRGPYRRWVHTHTFIDRDGGTLVRDEVDYEVPFALIAGWFVARDVRTIFDYRQKVLAEMFRAA